MKSLTPRLRDERGQALVLALAIIVIGLVLGLGAIAFALNVSGQATHDERTRASQQAADAGLQTQLFDQSDSDAVGYNLNPNAVLGVSDLLECTVPEVNSLGQTVGTIQLSVSNGPCPSEVPSSCASNPSMCTNISTPWNPVSNETFSESELFPNAQTQGSAITASGAKTTYAVLFPQIVSLGCHTTDTVTGKATCGAPNSVPAKLNSYSREMAVLDPTAPLQVLEGENDVNVSSPLLGVTSVIDGNIVAGHNLTVPNLSAPANLSGLSLTGTLTSLLSGQIGALSNLNGIDATLDYGFHCNTTLLGFTTADSCPSSLGATTGLYQLKQTSSNGSPNVCTAGSPSTACFLKRPGFSLSALAGAGGPTCPTALSISYSGLPATGGCHNGFLSYTGNVTLTAPGTYVFCNVNVGGQVMSTGSGPIQIFVVGPGQDGCSNGFSVYGTAKVDSTSSGVLEGPASLKIDFTDASSGGTTPYASVAWNYGDGSTATGTAGGTVSHTYTTPGSYSAVETVTDGAGLSASYTFTVDVTGPALSVQAPNCTISAASGVVCSDSVVGGTPNGTGNYTYTWNFGDNGSKGDINGNGAPGAVSAGAITGTTLAASAATGYDYKAPGTYLVSFTATDSTGASQTGTATVTDSPLSVTGAVGPATVTQGTASSFSGANVAGGLGGYRFSWNFGDGGKGTVSSGAAAGTMTTASVPTVGYTYAAPGSYVATLTVTSADGQTATEYLTSIIVNAPVLSGNGLSLGSQTITAAPATGTGSFTATFSVNPGSCSALSTISYSWSFPDGSGTTKTSTSPSPTHPYSVQGIYQATVTVTCSLLGVVPLSENYVVTVVVKPTATPLIPFASATPPSASTSGSTVTFTGQASGGSGTGYSYKWSYGDGSTGTGSPATHSYTAAGTYTAVMTVTDSASNTATYDLTVIVASTSSPPTVTPSISPSGPVAPGASVAFTATIDGGTSPYASYMWNFGDGSSQTVTSPTPETTGGDTYGPLTHTYSTAGTYVASLTATDAGGLTSSTRYVTVIVSPTGQGASTGGNFVASGGVNQLVTNSLGGLLNGAPITTNAVDPSAFQIYMQGNPSDSLVQGNNTNNNPSGPGASQAPSTYATIGGSSNVLDAFVVYAPRSSVNISTTAFEGSAIGWNDNISSLAVLQDLDLGNNPLSSIINAYQVAQTIECDNSVVPLADTSGDTKGCT